MRLRWQVRDQFPEDGRPALRRAEFLGMDDLEPLMPVPLLLSDWQTDGHRRVPDGKYGLLQLALRITEPDLVRAAGLGCRHHSGDGRVVRRSTQFLTRKFVPSSSARQ